MNVRMDQGGHKGRPNRRPTDEELAAIPPPPSHRKIVEHMRSIEPTELADLKPGMTIALGTVRASVLSIGSSCVRMVLVGTKGKATALGQIWKRNAVFTVGKLRLKHIRTDGRVGMFQQID